MVSSTAASWSLARLSCWTTRVGEKDVLFETSFATGESFSENLGEKSWLSCDSSGLKLDPVSTPG